ncbi:MAG: RluA family pseudouridine synthase [Chromatocurvus sp.]
MPERPDANAPRVRHCVVDERSEGQRLDNFLIREMQGVPKTRLYRALRKGEIRVNKGRARADYRLSPGDVVRLPPLHQASRKEAAVVPYYWSERLSGRIVLRDDRLLVINKPSGLAVHGGSGLDFGLIECLRQIYSDDRHLELVHRLDRDTSGLILVSRQPRALRELHGLLRGDGVNKEYLALASGHWPRHLTRVEAPLEKNTLQSGERMVRVAKGGKASLTAFSVIRYVGDATLLRASPITGRTHQIRIHARHAGFPLLGDEKYQDERSAALTRQLGLQRLFLHAERLRFRLADVDYDLAAELDDDLAALIEPPASR